MRIGIRAGHNVYNNGVFDVGAVGVGVTEAKFVKDTVAELKRRVVGDVVDLTPYNERFRRAKDHHVEMHRRAEKYGVDLIVDVHMNSSKSGLGNGVECFVYPGSKSRKYAERICGEISKYGLRNRGVKEHKTFWTLVEGKTPAIIVEGGFINNAGDMSKLNVSRYATSLIRALGLKEKSSDVADSKGIKDFVSKGSRIVYNDMSLDMGQVIYKGENYIKVKGLDRLGFDVDYVDREVRIKEKDGNSVVYSGEDFGVLGTLRAGVNYVPIRVICDILGYEVEYKDGKVYIKEA